MRAPAAAIIHAEAPCALGPFLPGHIVRENGPMRLFLEIDAGEGGSLSFCERDPKTGEIVAEGVIGENHAFHHRS